jgi:hypothetical protein
MSSPFGFTVQVGSTLPAFTETPTFKIDQSEEGESNAVELKGLLPAFTETPEFSISQVSPGTSNGVVIKGSSALGAGTVTLSTEEESISDSEACTVVLVQNDPDNVDNILVGNETTQVMKLKPGMALSIPVTDVSMIWAKSVSGTPTLNYLAT